MLKRIVNLGVLLVIVFSFGACMEIPPKTADWDALYQRAQEWGYKDSFDDFIAMLLGESGENDDPRNVALTAYEIFQKYNTWYLNDEAQWIFDVLEGNLEFLVELNQPMPQIWEKEVEGLELDYSAIGFDLPSVFISNVAEITVGKDITVIDWHILDGCPNLENIYVEEGNRAFVSDGGVLYSKSCQTLYKWPRKKPVTVVRKTVKYFAPSCFLGCEMPKDFELPEDTISIGSRAFVSTNLTKLHIKKNVKTVGSNIYPQDSIYPSTIQEVEISAPVVYQNFFNFNASAVEAEPKLTIIFRDGVNQIRPMCNKKREHLNILHYAGSIILPDTLEMIGDVSFPVNCSVRNYVLHENVKFLDKYAFDDYLVCFPEPSPESDILDPFLFTRINKTEFEYENKYAEQYIQKMLLVWERTAKLIK